MQRIKVFYVLIFFIVFGFISFAQDSTNSITVEQLYQKIKNDKNVVILNVRTKKELTGPLGKISGIINIPIQELDKRFHELDKFKNKKIAVICRTGARSLKGTKLLAKKGFDVENVLGGMVKYRKAGY